MSRIASVTSGLLPPLGGFASALQLSITALIKIPIAIKFGNFALERNMASSFWFAHVDQGHHVAYGQGPSHGWYFAEISLHCTDTLWVGDE
jgi:hypothetical protein